MKILDRKCAPNLRRVSIFLSEKGVEVKPASLFRVRRLVSIDGMQRFSGAPLH